MKRAAFEITTDSVMKVVSRTLAPALFSLCILNMTGLEAKANNASWYGPGFQGRKTASGERFNTHQFTAAHKSLPFGTRVKVVNVTTGRAVVVRINDRGPFVRGRVIDLSHAAAKAIGMTGLARVALARL
jgi:rare lipoprotein A